MWLFFFLNYSWLCYNHVKSWAVRISVFITCNCTLMLIVYRSRVHDKTGKDTDVFHLVILHVWEHASQHDKHTIGPRWHIRDSWVLSGSHNADGNGLIAAPGPLPLINQLHSTQGWHTAVTDCTTPTVQYRKPWSKQYVQMFVLLSWQMDRTYCIKAVLVVSAVKNTLNYTHVRCFWNLINCLLLKPQTFIIYSTNDKITC